MAAETNSIAAVITIPHAAVKILSLMNVSVPIKQLMKIFQMIKSLSTTYHNNGENMSSGICWGTWLTFLGLLPPQRLLLWSTTSFQWIGQGKT